MTLKLADKGGFEPPIGYEPIHAFQACDLNHSSICPKLIVLLERVKGIEPSSKAWEAFVLPLNYTRCGKPRHYKRRLLFLIPFTVVYFP